MAHPHTVLIADDDFLVREAYRAFFSRTPEFTLCGEARNGAEAVTAFETLRPDVVLMDLQMPGTSGIEATRQICERWPGACVVALTTFGTRDYIVPALQAGAGGYLLKDSGAEVLRVGIKQALAGEMPLSSSVRRALVSAVTDRGSAEPAATVSLTPRESELLTFLAQGLTNLQIASQMYVSEGSVKQYLSHIGDKLGVKSRTQILVRSIQLNLVDPRDMPPVTD